LRKRFPKWNTGGDIYKDSYFNSKAGWAESGRVLGKRMEEAASLGIKLVEGEDNNL
jgi:hypothetical protein